MKKAQNSYVCSNCGAPYSRWQGECSQCHQWNTIVENISLESVTTKIKTKKVEVSKLKDIISKTEPVVKIGIPGFENVMGGGIFESQIALIAGEPGIGKSTLLLQILKNYPYSSCYISGEESLSQIAKRADRLDGLSLEESQDKSRVTNNSFDRTDFVSSTDLNTDLSVISSGNYRLVIIDSIQTLIDPESAGFAGSANQVRLCTFKITEIAKKYNVSVIIVGQITKEGEIAGPKMMEHLVDTVLYFEGDRKSDLRILKSYKNRFGSVGETAIFEMHQTGLIEINDPAKYFLGDNKSTSEGIAHSIVSDGSMIYAVEIQALVTKSFFQFPKRLATNYDNNRFQMLLAVLQKKLSLSLSDKDIYINIAGGIKVNDTSADLAVCAAIISSCKGKALTSSVFIGEVGLTGNIQRTSRHESKITQAERLGFKHVYSYQNVKEIKTLVEFVK